MADRISSLPDPLLLQILSYLKIKEGIATSLLSKRWRFLWRYLPNLEFHDLHFRMYDFFLQFMDATLLFVDLKPVQKFVLNCEYYSVPPIRVNIWLNALLSHNSITYLEVHLRQRDTFYRLPSRVFTRNTISVLKLSGFSCNVSTVDLPSLKVLHLLDMGFSKRECLNLILSNCLHLEELVLRYLFMDHYSSIKVGRLEHLLFADVPDSLISWEAFTNVQFLHFNDCSKRIAHRAPTFHNVIHLELNKFFCHDDWMTMSYLQCFPKLQSLLIHQFKTRSDFDEEKIEPALDVPPCVSYHLKEFVVLGFNGSKKEVGFVRLIMENATVLRTVIVGSAYESQWGGFEMFKRISSFLICSANCRLFFDVSKKNIEEAMRKCLTIRKLYAIPSYENFMF